MKGILKYLSISRRELWTIVLIFILWRTILFGVGLTADLFLKYKPSFPYWDTLLPSFTVPRSVYSWANFDGVHYLTIANQGYSQVRFVQAFFPLFPFVILRPLAVFSQVNLMATGLILGQVFALFACVIWFLLVKSHFGQKTAWLALLILLLFPTSFFLGALYTEGLFLLLVFSSFLMAGKKMWLISGLLAALASATRVIGIFLVPALLLELYLSSDSMGSPWRFKSLLQFVQKEFKNICFVLLGSTGLLAYMFYLKLIVNDPLAFFHSQSAFGAGRQTTLVLYPQVFFRALKIILTTPMDLKYIAYIQEFAAGSLGLLGLLFSAKYVRKSWILFALLAFFLPTATGTFSSMGRYLLVSFPIFILLAIKLQTHSKIIIFWTAISLLLLILNTILFIQGYWVA